ncbi:MAG: ABC transporter ATP-binding protein [Nitrososphaerales archaeon]|jgi:ABC-2 type transport system ATP-binding protein
MTEADVSGPTKADGNGTEARDGVDLNAARDQLLTPLEEKRRQDDARPDFHHAADADLGLGARARTDLQAKVVDVSKLGKVYPGGTEALRDVSFSIERGHVFCLLGRNGAGKTTLLRILATQLQPSTGRATVFGLDVPREAEKVRTRIAVLPQEARPQMMLSAFDHVRMMCLIRGMPRAEATRRANQILERFDLWEHRNKVCADLSGGMRQRVLLCMALIADPELLFLDEPTIGLDPLGRRQVWAAIRRLTKAGTTVLLTTHYMDEAEHLADNLAIIEKGRVAFLGTVGEAKDVAGVGMRMIVEPLVNGGRREVLHPSSNEEILKIVERSVREGLKVTFQPPSLEEAFINIVGGSIDDEAQ